MHAQDWYQKENAEDAKARSHVIEDSWCAKEFVSSDNSVLQQIETWTAGEKN